MDFWDIANIANAISDANNNKNSSTTTTNNNLNKNKKKKKAPFKEQLKNTVFLLKNTFKIVWMNKDIFTPTKASITYSIVLRVIFFTMAGMFFINPLIGFILLLIWTTGFIYKFFYFAKQKSNQSYLVFNTISGKNLSYEEGLSYIKNDFNKYKSIAFIDMLRGYIEKANNGNSGGIKGMIMSLFLSGLEEVLDLVSNYLLPAMVIENKGIVKVTDDLKGIKGNIPEALVWVFWIDFLWSAINKLFGIIYFTLFLVSGLIGWWIGFISETLVITIAEFNISLIPIIIVIFIASIISVIILRMVDGVKVVYFSIFYTNIMKSEVILDELKTDLNSYLKFQKTDEVK